VDEFELIRRYFVRANEGSGVIVGIGDDAAVLQPDPGRELVVVVDTLVSGVHFPADIAAADLGYRAVAVNLSDIAAMGARPRWMTLALTIPAAGEGWLADFAAGLFEAAAGSGVVLVGGDTTRGDSVVVSVQITGDIRQGDAVLRSGARAGDTVFVTGTVGDAAAGLELLAQGRADEYLASRLLRPCARVRYGQLLPGRASAAIDISDGLAGDLQKLLEASGVGAELDLDRLPLSDALCRHFDRDDRLRFALTGGDDYELCFTAAAGTAPDGDDVRVTAIGTIVAGGGLRCHDQHGVVAVEDGGYRHFR
jgi:thiamine-monophosphate kinase